MALPKDFEPTPRARHRQIHRLLDRLLDDGELVVDIGAGFGQLGLVAQTAGRLRYVGFEPSRSVAAFALRRGVALRAELFSPNSIEEAPSAIVLDNVIEHVTDPLGLLDGATGSLRPDGVLVVIVPNRYDVRQIVPSWRTKNHWIPPEHINYFTAKSLKSALEGLGLAVRPFGFRALGWRDWRYWPRALLELIGLFPFGINVYGRKEGPVLADG